VLGVFDTNAAAEANNVVRMVSFIVELRLDEKSGLID
jgi:hypothetical protein